MTRHRYSRRGLIRHQFRRVRRVFSWIRWRGCELADFRGDDCRMWSTKYKQQPCRPCAERFGLKAVLLAQMKEPTGDAIRDISDPMIASAEDRFSHDVLEAEWREGVARLNAMEEPSDHGRS